MNNPGHSGAYVISLLRMTCLQTDFVLNMQWMKTLSANSCFLSRALQIFFRLKYSVLFLVQ